MPHLVETLIYLSQIYSYYTRGARSSLNLQALHTNRKIENENRIYATPAVKGLKQIEKDYSHP